MEELIQLISKTYGIVGLLILAPVVALGFLYKDHRKLIHSNAKQVEDWETRIAQVQEQRVKDAQEVTKKLMEIVGEQSSLSKETNLALDRIGEVLDNVSKMMQQMLIHKS
jgi:hypothetical protein